jgi:hypothetical protein
MATRRRAFIRAAAILAAAALATAGAQAQDASRGRTTGKADPANSGFDVLTGNWIRPDGGYRITIRSASADGRLDASYANPNVLPFAVAQAAREGGTLKAYFLLRAGGYNGSSYTLTYDAGKDVLRGVFFQAVSGQRYEVQFVRGKW